MSNNLQHHMKYGRERRITWLSFLQTRPTQSYGKDEWFINDVPSPFFTFSDKSRYRTSTQANRRYNPKPPGVTLYLFTWRWFVDKESVHGGNGDYDTGEQISQHQSWCDDPREWYAGIPPKPEHDHSAQPPHTWTGLNVEVSYRLPRREYTSLP